MVAKLYKVADSTYVVADDVFIQQGEFPDGSEPDWISSEPLDEDDLQDLAKGEIDLSDFDLDADQGKDWSEFVEVPRQQWVNLFTALN